MHPNDGRVVSGFILQALRGEPITLFGDGSQTRSFCYVDDLIEGIVRFMNTDNGFIGPLNLGNPAGLSIRSLAEKILSLTGSGSALVFNLLPDDDPRQRQPDIRLAKEKLDWEPEFTLDDGLLQTIAYFDSQLSNGSALEHGSA